LCVSTIPGHCQSREALDMCRKRSWWEVEEIRSRQVVERGHGRPAMAVSLWSFWSCSLCVCRKCGTTSLPRPSQRPSFPPRSHLPMATVGFEILGPVCRTIRKHLRMRTLGSGRENSPRITDQRDGTTRDSPLLCPTSLPRDLQTGIDARVHRAVCVQELCCRTLDDVPSHSI
jgi:hypothetical protein